MRKVFIVLAILAVSAFASDPRLMVLGGDSRLLINDYLEMWAYPGTIGDYEFVTGSSQTEDMHDGWFGIVDDLGGSTYGLTINHMGYGHEVLYSPGNWGAILSLDFDKYPSDSITTTKDMRIGLAWGTEVSLFADYSDLALGFGYDMETGERDETDLSASDINIAASLRGHADGFFNLFPIMSANVEMTTVDTYEDASLQTTDFDIDFGAGRNKKVADNTNLVLGVFGGLESFSYGGDYEDMDSHMWITVPSITGGVEQEIGKWFIFRAGAESTTRYHSNGDFNEFGTSFETHFGVGFHKDNFMMDATIGEDFLHDGPYMVGGTANGFMGSLAATYNF